MKIFFALFVVTLSCSLFAMEQNDSDDYFTYLGLSNPLSFKTTADIELYVQQLKVRIDSMSKNVESSVSSYYIMTSFYRTLLIELQSVFQKSWCFDIVPENLQKAAAEILTLKAQSMADKVCIELLTKDSVELTADKNELMAQIEACRKELTAAVEKANSFSAQLSQSREDLLNVRGDFESSKKMHKQMMYCGLGVGALAVVSLIALAAVCLKLVA